MIPARFHYHRPQSLDEALGLLGSVEDAKILAGGHSLLPAMKLRLAQPRNVIDIGRIPNLNHIREQNGRIHIGALATHHAIATSDLLRSRCPLLPEVAAEIGDVQVRHRGTLGGSLAHADPAADWPAPILALDAEIEIAGLAGRRVVRAADFFVDMMQSAVQPNEILVEVRVPVTTASVAYAKFAQKASGFAIAGAAVVVNTHARRVQVGITGVAPKAYRATAVEEALAGSTLNSAAIARAAARAADGIEALNDIHASAEYRAHLACVQTRRALEMAVSR
ncbi:MAG TPA: xanthine dehydrogenase family protein subunit M [Methylomirabilota bacterium]|nr:xanthine dehydrogenase family protein subunit M [Methylomirabilota bacterium]